MASSPQIDIDSLLEPIPGDEPAGNAVPFNIRRELDDYRKEVNLEAFAADDPMRPESPKAADWAAIIDKAQETLKETSKDMLVAARLTEALAKEHGFGGLRDGLTLMRRMTEDCWDRIHPSIEDGDLEVRAAAFNWLDDADRGGRFPHTIRAIGFLPGDERKFGWKDWRDVMDGKGDLQKETIEAATETLTREEIQDVIDDITEAIAEVDKIVEITNEKMADLAPGLSEVRGALRDCLQIAEPILKKKGPAPDEASEESADFGSDETSSDDLGDFGADTGSGDDDTPAPRQKRGNSRAEVYKQLEDVSNRLLQVDPHSPVSYMVQRAVRLSKLTLPQLLKALIRNDDVLGDLNRDLDLGVDDSPSSGDNDAGSDSTDDDDS